MPRLEAACMFSTGFWIRPAVAPVRMAVGRWKTWAGKDGMEQLCAAIVDTSIVQPLYEAVTWVYGQELLGYLNQRQCSASKLKRGDTLGVCAYRSTIMLNFRLIIWPSWQDKGNGRRLISIS